MGSLPSEIWSLIVELLDRRDLRSARLVNKKLSALSTPKLFNTIFLRPTKRSFVHSVCIAESLKLSAMVLRLECVGEGLDGYETSRKDFDREVGATLAGLEADLEKDYSKLGRDYLYTNFRSWQISQNEWSDSHYVTKVEQLASRLPRLVELWCITANNENIETYWGTDHDWLFRY